jgi:hypothetical protein
MSKAILPEHSAVSSGITLPGLYHIKDISMKVIFAEFLPA